MFKKIINKLFKKPKDTMSFMESMNLVGLPIVTFFQGDNRFNFILDTGSNKSIIDKNILPMLKHSEIIYDKDNSLLGMDGINHNPGVCAISFYYKEKEYFYDGYLVQDMSGVFKSIKEDSGITLHGLLGAQFFNKFKYVLDFNKLIAYSEGCRGNK